MDLKRRHFLGGLAALSATALTCPVISEAEAEARAAPADGRGAGVGPEKWLSQLPDSAALRDLTLPGTHNSGARYGGSYTECQNTTIAEQLTSGIRFLDIRCRLIDGSFAIHHGATYQNLNFADVLDACRDFLAAQPSETVLMRVRQEYSEESADAFLAVFNDYLGLVEEQFRKAATQPGMFYVNYVSTAALLPLRSNADRLNPRVKDLLASSEGAGWHGLGIVPMDFPNENGMTDALVPHQPAPSGRVSTR